MMKRVILLFLELTIACNLLCQDQNRYAELINQAGKLSDSEAYLEAARIYTTAFRSTKNTISVIDRIKAAAAWSKAGLPDSSFHQLSLMANDSSFTAYNYILMEPELNSLHNDARWEEIIEKVKENIIRIEGNLNPDLVAILDTVFQDDQKYRLKLADTERKYGRDSRQLGTLWVNIVRNDSVNLAKTINFIAKYGWPGPDIIGTQGTATLWLVIQHSDLNTQLKYLPVIKEAAAKGYLDRGKVALLEDRIALRENKKQIYGSQIGFDDETGKYYVLPLMDPDSVDKRRTEVGLGKLQDYVKEWGIIWNAEEYKKKFKDTATKTDKR